MTGRKTVFCDVYQTLVDVDLQAQNAPRDWVMLADMIRDAYTINIDGDLFGKRISEYTEEFYRRKRDESRLLYHHDLKAIVARIVQELSDVDLKDGEIDSVLYTFRKSYRGFIALYPGVAEVLSELSQKYNLVAASYTQACSTEGELAELGIADFFSHRVYSSDIGYRKANPKFYETCIEIAGANPSDCVMIGDHYEDDVLVPKSFGMKAIWVCNPISMNRFDVRAEDVSPSVAIGDFEKIPDIVSGLFEK